MTPHLMMTKGEPISVIDFSPEKDFHRRMSVNGCVIGVSRKNVFSRTVKRRILDITGRESNYHFKIPSHSKFYGTFIHVNNTVNLYYI